MHQHFVFGLFSFVWLGPICTATIERTCNKHGVDPGRRVCETSLLGLALEMPLLALHTT
jgi:phage-related protein